MQGEINSYEVLVGESDGKRSLR